MFSYKHNLYRKIWQILFTSPRQTPVNHEKNYQLWTNVNSIKKQSLHILSKQQKRSLARWDWNLSLNIVLPITASWGAVYSKTRKSKRTLSTHCTALFTYLHFSRSHDLTFISPSRSDIDNNSSDGPVSQ